MTSWLGLGSFFLQTIPLATPGRWQKSLIRQNSLQNQLRMASYYAQTNRFGVVVRQVLRQTRIFRERYWHGNLEKVALALLTTGILAIGGCIALLDHLFSDMCGTTVTDQVASPSGQLKAVVFQIDCGATTGFNTQVAIVPGSRDISGKDAIPKSFFAADGNHGKAPEGKVHGPEVRLHWLSDSSLEIQHHELARVIRAEQSSKGVAVAYRTFRQ
jgi:hypothetical protein